MNIDTHAGYNFNPIFSLFLRAETNVSLLKTGEEKERKGYINETLGALLKCNMYRFDYGIVDVRTGVGTTLNSKDMKYLYYDAGLYFQVSRSYTKPAIGIGVRYYDNQDKNKKDYLLPYISIGFVVN